MIQNGTGPTRLNHKDYDFVKSHGFGGIVTQPAFVDEYFADAGLTMPDQDNPDTEFMPPTPSMPFGCTDFTQAELATDLTKQVHNPNDVEAITHANALGGLDIRVSLDACRTQLGWFKQYFSVRASGMIDFFDTFRLAQIAGIDVNENRSITWGTPWFPSWEQAAIRGVKIMPMPTLDELTAIRSNQRAFSWHNSKLDGWTTLNGVIMYRDKSWQGTAIGFLFFPREVVNMTMTINGTVGFTATRNVVIPQTIDVTKLQWIVSVLKNLISKYVYVL